MCTADAGTFAKRVIRHFDCNLKSVTWLMGLPTARFWKYLSSVLFAGVVSLISLAVLSYERYCTMMGATQADSTNYRKVVMGIAFSWIYSMVWTVPPLFGWSRYCPEGPGTTCSVDWTAKTANNVSYIVCLFIFCLILPFVVIVYSYGRLLQAITQVGVTTFLVGLIWLVIDFIRYSFSVGVLRYSPCKTC